MKVPLLVGWEPRYVPLLEGWERRYLCRWVESEGSSAGGLGVKAPLLEGWERCSLVKRVGQTVI